MVKLARLQEGAHSLLAIDLNQEQLETFAWYRSELEAWNLRFNLTAIIDPLQIETKHFLDSLTCLLAAPEGLSGRIVDVGTGAGFPGLPLKIVFPEIRLTLVESSEKKANFCRHVVEELGIKRVEILHARAEDIGQQPEFRHKFDYALARAVAPLPVLAEYLLPLLHIGGRAVAQKGSNAPAEAHAAEEALRILGGRVERLITIELPYVAETRYLVVIDKVAATPLKYPRRPGIPTKKPLGQI